jgi:preprotein translocase subunit SecF
LDFVGKRAWFFLVSALVIAPGIAFLIIGGGLKPGIDFTGGSTTGLEFAADVQQEELRSELTSLGYVDAIVQRMDDNAFFVRTKELQEEEKDSLVGNLESRLSPDGVTVLSFDLVSPIVAAETVVNAFYAILAAAVGVFLYVWWAFRNMPSPFRYGAAAIIALLHDTAVVVGVFAILGVLLDVEVNTMFLIALLTVIGYSVNDTIVVFDRLRENVVNYPNRTLRVNANVSVSQSLSRSLNTSLTLLFTLLALLLFGGPTIRNFLWVLLIGVVVGTYSSVAIATPALMVWEEGDIRRIFRRLRPS